MVQTFTGGKLTEHLPLDGVTPLDTGLAGLAFQQVFCGGVLGVSGSPTANSIVCKSMDFLVPYLDLVTEAVLQFPPQPPILGDECYI